MQQPLVPDTISVDRQPILGVQLPDGAIGAIFTYLCSALSLIPKVQIRRIRRNAVLRKALISVSIETAGGPQRMNVLLAWGIPLWLADVRLSGVAPALRERLEIFQEEVADVLYRHFILRADVASPALEEPPGPSRWQMAQTLEQLEQRVAALETLVADVVERLTAVEGQTVDVTERLRTIEVLIAALMREVAGISHPERLLAATIARLLVTEQRVQVLERSRRFASAPRRSRRARGRRRPADHRAK